MASTSRVIHWRKKLKHRCNNGRGNPHVVALITSIGWTESTELSGQWQNLSDRPVDGDKGDRKLQPVAVAVSCEPPVFDTGYPKGLCAGVEDCSVR
jgi:hypothetical protein